MHRFSLLLIPLVVATPLSAQTVRYEVSVARGEFHVTAEFPASGKDTLLVSLPAWSPGNYEIQNYARYVHGFGAKNASGQALRWDRADKDKGGPNRGLPPPPGAPESISATWAVRSAASGQFF